MNRVNNNMIPYTEKNRTHFLFSCFCFLVVQARYLITDKLECRIPSCSYRTFNPTVVESIVVSMIDDPHDAALEKWKQRIVIDLAIAIGLCQTHEFEARST